jgi:hypothetical protein
LGRFYSSTSHGPPASRQMYELAQQLHTERNDEILWLRILTAHLLLGRHFNCYLQQTSLGRSGLEVHKAAEDYDAGRDGGCSHCGVGTPSLRYFFLCLQNLNRCRP